MSGREDDTMNSASSDDGADVLAPVWTADGHLDEGTIHTWLDGAFDIAHAASIDAHVSACAVCAAHVAEARGLIAGASRMIRSLDLAPSGVVPSEDVARTASRIVAAALATGGAASDETARPPGTHVAATADQRSRAARPPRPWYMRAEWRVAAAAVLMVGGGAYVWSRSSATEAAFSPVASDRADTVDPAAPAVLSSPAEVASDARADVANAASVASASASAGSPSAVPEGSTAKAAPRVLPAAPAPTPVRDLAVVAPPPAAAVGASVPMAAGESVREVRDEVATDAARAKRASTADEARAPVAVAAASAEARRTTAPAAAPPPLVAGGVARAFTNDAAPRRRTVTGRVVTPTDAPVEGASVVVQGTTLGVQTDTRGEFVLRGVPDSSTLLVRRLGYQATRVSLPSLAADTLHTRVTLQVSAMTTLSAVAVQAGPPIPLPEREAERDGLANRSGLECWSLAPALYARSEDVSGTPPPSLMLTTNLGVAADVTSQWINWPIIGRETRVVLKRDEGGVYRGTGIGPGVQWTLEIRRQGTGWDATATGGASSDNTTATTTSRRLTLSRADVGTCRR